MSICTPCLKALPLATCTGELEIGTIALTDSSVNIYIHDITTGQIMQVAADSDADGVVTVDLSEKAFFDNHAYELWITDAGADMYDKQDITIGYETVDTVCLTFNGVVTLTGDPVVYANQVITQV